MSVLLMATSNCGSVAAPQAPVATASAPDVPSTGAEAPPAAAAPGLTHATVIELATLRSDTASFDWFQFKPGVKKLILSGTPDARHVSVLWYGYEGKAGAVPLHYHAKTESIFVIDGEQSDPKGRYAKGSLYFNPPGSGHNVFDSAGLFLLAYAAPPDFTKTASIAPYENLVIGSDYSQLKFAPCEDGSVCYPLPLAAEGGMSARFVKPQAKPLTLTANVIIVLQGSCTIAGRALPADTLLVNKSTQPESYEIIPSSDCLLYELAFR